MIYIQISEIIKTKKVEWGRKVTINEVAEATGISHMTLFRMMKKQQKIALAIAALSYSFAAHASCGSAFCALNTDAGVQGTWSKPGVRLDIRAEFIDMDQLRHGASKAQAQGVVDEHDEVRTINRNFLANLDWNINKDWGLSVRVPLLNRSHNHLFNADDGSGGIDPEVESWHFSSLGDIQALARYNFFSDGNSNAGLRFGLQLPTGSTHEKNDAGELAERMLQPGTGSLETLLGAYYNQHHGALAWFAQGMWQQAVTDRNNYKPGAKLGVDAGLSYAITPDLSLLAQANYLHKFKDSGANAEPADSGGDSVFVSPGFSYRFTPDMHLYGFLQKPLYQRVNGFQLTSDWSAAAGLSLAF